MAKSKPSLILTNENEITEDCAYCGQPFELDYRNKEQAVEIDGSEWVHRSCARDFAERLAKIAS